MAFETIRLEPEAAGDGRLYVLTLNRPEVRNAIDRQMIDELGRALDEIRADPEARALIVTGAGEKSFAAGADIAELRDRTVLDALERINVDLFRKIEEHPLPSIAAIRGYALGGGCELAMACDLRVAGRGAKLGQPEVGLGILPGAGAIQRLPRLVGIGRAKELIYTGRIIDAAEAQAIGLVNHVVDDAEVMDAARRIARTIAEQGHLAVRLAKQAINANFGPERRFETLDVLGQAVLFESEDKHRRMTAFLERRSARRAGEEGTK
jgi:enoyl-CoA hydratase